LSGLFAILAIATIAANYKITNKLYCETLIPSFLIMDLNPS